MQSVLKQSFLCLGFFLFCGFSSLFASSIVAYPMKVDLTTDSPFADITVQNTGKDTAYVATSVYKMDNPSAANPTFSKLQDNPEQIGLIVDPEKMVIPPGQMRLARISYVGNPVNSDAIYEVKFSPVVGDLVSLASNNKEVNAGIQLVIAYGIATYVHPLKVQANLQFIHTEKTLSLFNSGNISIFVGNCRQCTKKDPQKCQNLPIDAMLYPGSKKIFSLPQNLPVTCDKQILQNQPQEISSS